MSSDNQENSEEQKYLRTSDVSGKSPSKPNTGNLFDTQFTEDGAGKSSETDEVSDNYATQAPDHERTRGLGAHNTVKTNVNTQPPKVPDTKQLREANALSDHDTRSPAMKKSILGDNLSDLSRGAIIDDKYEIVELIGKGGMSTVFQVQHRELGTILALKVLDKSAWQDPDAVKRFKLEAQTIGMLTHPCLITYRDFGITQSGQPYLVMDYVQGRDLHEILEEQGTFTLSSAYNLWLQVCAGLSVAHNKGIVHRDLKPGNIMFDEGDNGQVKIVDFGVAKIVSEDANQMQNLTRTGEVFGSPLYMSPEQCKGQKIDHRSDIYSLGCVIYETITGVHPIAGNTMLDTLSNHVEKMHPPPLKIDPGLASVERTGWVNPEDFQYVLMKCLQKSPKDRYQSLDEIVEDLKRLKDNTLVKQDLPTATVNTLRQQEILEPKTSPKEMISMVATVLGISIAVGGAGVGAWYFLFSQKPRVVEKPAQKTASAAEAEAAKLATKDDAFDPNSINLLTDGTEETKDASASYFRALHYMKNKKYSKAILLLKFSINSYKEQGGQDFALAQTYRQLANCYVNLETPNYTEAFNNFKNAKDIYKSLPGGAGGPQYQQCSREYAQALRAFGAIQQAEAEEKFADSFRPM